MEVSFPEWSDFSDLVVPISAGFALVGFLIVFGFARRRRKRVPATTQKGLAFQCPTCRNDLVIPRASITAMSAPEMALLVSVRHEMLGRSVGEFRCSQCGEDHYFCTDVRPPVWVASGIFEPRAAVAHCSQCHRELARPPWRPGEYDGRPAQAPGLRPEHGLYCTFCKSVSCFDCAKSITRNRTKDGSLLCPRCSRGPLETFHYF